MVEKNTEGKSSENTPSLESKAKGQSWSEVDQALNDANWKIENSEIETKIVEKQEDGMIIDEQARGNNEENKNESILTQIKKKQQESQKKDGKHDGGVYQNDEVTVK